MPPSGAGLCRASGEIGHSVTFFEKDVSYYRTHRDLLNPEQYELCLYSDWNDVESDARQQLANADCAIVTSYCPDARAATELMLDSKVRLRLFYDLDTPVTLKAFHEHAQVPYIPPFGLEPFDLVLSYTGGRALGELKVHLGARRVAPLYGCVNTSCHRRVPPTPHYTCDFSYLGTYALDRQKLRQLQAVTSRKVPALTLRARSLAYNPTAIQQAHQSAHTRVYHQANGNPPSRIPVLRP